MNPPVASGTTHETRTRFISVLLEAMRTVARSTQDEELARVRAAADEAIEALQVRRRRDLAAAHDGLGQQLRDLEAELAREQTSRIRSVEIETDDRILERQQRCDTAIALVLERASAAEVEVDRAVTAYEEALERAFDAIRPLMAAATEPEAIIAAVRSLPDPPLLFASPA